MNAWQLEFIYTPHNEALTYYAGSSPSFTEKSKFGLKGSVKHRTSQWSF